MNRDALLFEDENKDIILTLIMKLTPEQLKAALPISYCESTKHTDREYLIAMFKNGNDYLNYGTYLDVKKLVTKYNMISILENDYDKTLKHLKNITKNNYQELRSFAKKQLKIENI